MPLFSCNWRRKRAAVRGEDEGDLVFVPRAAEEYFVALSGEAAAVATRLWKASGNVFDVALGFGDAERGQADEQNVIRRTAGGRPFGDGAVEAALWTRAAGEGQFFGVYLPAGLPELGIHALARGGFVLVGVVNSA